MRRLENMNPMDVYPDANEKLRKLCDINWLF